MQENFGLIFRTLNMRTYPRSGFRFGGTSELTLPFGKAPFGNPDLSWHPVLVNQKSLPMSEHFWLFLDLASDRAVFSAHVKDTAIAWRREENPETLMN